MHRAVIACQRTRRSPVGLVCVWWCGARRHVHWLAHGTSNSCSVGMGWGWGGMDMLRLAWLVDGWLVYLADWYPMRSCDTVQQIFHSSSSRYAVLYIFVVVVFLFLSGYPQKRLKLSPLVTVTVTTIPVVYFSSPLRARYLSKLHLARTRCKGWDKGTQPPPANRLIHTTWLRPPEKDSEIRNTQRPHSGPQCQSGRN